MAAPILRPEGTLLTDLRTLRRATSPRNLLDRVTRAGLGPWR